MVHLVAAVDHFHLAEELQFLVLLLKQGLEVVHVFWMSSQVHFLFLKVAFHFQFDALEVSVPPHVSPLHILGSQIHALSIEIVEDVLHHQNLLQKLNVNLALVLVLHQVSLGEHLQFVDLFLEAWRVASAWSQFFDESAHLVVEELEQVGVDLAHGLVLLNLHLKLRFLDQHLVERLFELV